MSPGNFRHVGDQRRRRRGHHLFEVIDVAKAIGQRCVDRCGGGHCMSRIGWLVGKADAISNQLDTSRLTSPRNKDVRLMAAAPRIKTTVVGSYPMPDWLLALPSEQALIDATRVVIHTQEQAGIDLVCDGEFSRFDVNHPETNGMIEYFVRPMAGMRTAITFDELIAYRSQRGMGFRTRPPAVVDGAVGAGTLDLPHACARGRRLAVEAVQVHADRPAHAGEKRDRQALWQRARSCDGDRATRSPRRSSISTPMWCRSTKRTFRAAPTNGNGRRPPMNRVLDAVKTTPAVHLCFGNYGGQTIQKGEWGKLIDYLNALHVDHIVMETAHRPAEELVGVPRFAAGDRLRLGCHRRQIDRDRIRRRDRAQHRARRRACSARAASATSIPIAASGCSNAASPTARCVR